MGDTFFEDHGIIALAGPRAEARFRGTDPNSVVAVHEAGHVIAGRALRCRVSAASILPETHADGSISAGRVLFGRDRERAAGPLPSTPNDMRVVEVCAAWSIGVDTGAEGKPEDPTDQPKVAAVLLQFHDEVEALLDKHWPALEAIAVELMCRKEIGAAEINEALQPFGL